MNKIQTYDLLVIGGGIAGYSAALKASDKLKVAIIEEKFIGGTCLNRGCIPTKSYRWLSKQYTGKINNLYTKKNDGFSLSDQDRATTADFIKEKVVSLREGLSQTISNANIDMYQGRAVIANDNTVTIKKDDELYALKFEYLLLAMGSEPIIPDICNSMRVLKKQMNNVVTTDDVFKKDNIAPESIVIVGGGVIGIEFASFLSNYGTNVSLVEQRDRLLPGFSEDISRTVAKLLRSKGIKIYNGWEVTDIQEEDDETIVCLRKISAGGESQINEILVNKVLLAVGRKARIDNNLLKSLSVDIENGRIIVNSYYQTSNPHVFAAGDVCSKIQLAYVAELQGKIVAEEVINNFIDKKKEFKFNTNPPAELSNIPVCVFMDPEIAQIGICEDCADDHYIISKSSLRANGLAVIQNSSDGYIKLIAEKELGRIVGVELVCPHAVEMISLCRIWIEKGMLAQEICGNIFPHPSISETIKDAAKKLIMRS